MVKKRAPHSIPDSLKELYKDRQRIRFHGFWLGKSEMDRTIADWLDDLPARDASAVVKTILYSYITGRIAGKLEGQRTSDAFGDYGDSEKALLGLED